MSCPPDARPSTEAGARGGVGPSRAGHQGKCVRDAAEAGGGGEEASHGAAAEGTGKATAVPSRGSVGQPPASPLPTSQGCYIFPGGAISPSPQHDCQDRGWPQHPLLSVPPQAQQRDLTVRRVKETEKELSRQLRQQREHYEATIQRHLTFIDQVVLPPG